jgi:type IV pilus assembly protein PilQ
MKTIQKILILLAVFILSGCAGIANRQMTKSDVPVKATDVRQNIEDIRRTNPVDRQDLAVESRGMTAQDRTKDLFELNRSSDPTVFSHPSWKPNKVTLNLANSTVIDYFTLLSTMTGINFIVGSEVKSDLSINVKNISWTELTEMILADKKLISYISSDGKTVRIHSVDFNTERSDSVKKILTQKIDEQKIRDGMSSQNTVVIRVFYTKADVIAKMLRDMLAGANPSASPGGLPPTGMSNRALFTVDVRTNSLIIQASATDIDWIKKTIEFIDKPSRQVLVEAFIVEGQDNFTQELGARLGLQNAGTLNSGNTITSAGIAGTLPSVDNTGAASTIGAIFNPSIAPTVGGLGLLVSSPLTTNQLKLELMAMQKDGLSKIISNPRLFIINNEQASITDGVQIAYPVPGVGPNQITYEFKDAALKLDVKPSIVGDGNIYIEVNVNKDSPNYTTNPPGISKREVKTKLLIRDGGVAMIGGINTSSISSNDDKLPGFADIPFVGNLFKATAQGNQRTQLYIFLAPSAI